MTNDRQKRVPREEKRVPREGGRRLLATGGPGLQTTATVERQGLSVGIGHVPEVFFAIATIPFVAQALGGNSALIAALRVVIPVGVLAPDRILALLSAIGLASLALGLHRKKRLAWRVATMTLGGGVFLQLLFGARPIALALGAITIAALVVDRRHYRTRSADGFPVALAWILGIAALAVGVEALLAVPDLSRDVRVDVRAVVLAVASWASFSDRWLAFRHAAPPLALLPTIFSRLMETLGLVGSLRSAGPPRLDDIAGARARAIVARLGGGALLPFQLGRDVRLYAMPDATGAVAYGHAGRSVVVLGDPIGERDGGWRALQGLRDECAVRDQSVMVYQASGESRQQLLASGFTLFRVGQEAIVPLDGFTLAGSRRANLRHTITRARRGGLTVRWLPDGLSVDEEPGLVEAMRRVDTDWARKRPGRMGFTISAFIPEALRDSAISIALEADGTIAAFATFRPTGADGGRVLDLMRRASAGTPGAMELCIADAAERMRDAGVPYLSLGLAPLAGLSPTDGPVEERLLARAAAVAGEAYDAKGLSFFKAKFDPEWVPRYGAIRGRSDLPLFALSLLRLHLGGLRGVAAAALSLAAIPRRVAGRRPA